jgi:DnaJ-class molecular chaperone
MRDPYDVLGVQKSANADDVKRAYRKLAKKLHPDANTNDPKAAQRFAELNSAYEILGEEDKRKAFDRGEIDAEGKPRFRGFEGFGHGHPGGAGAGREGVFETFSFGPEGFRRSGGGRSGFGGGGGFEDIIKDMFGGAARGARGGFAFEPEDFGPAPSRDIQAALTITLPEAASGTTKRVHLPSGKDVEVKIPAGLADGQQIRLRGQGLPGAAGAGDVLISVSIATHPLFTRDGNDLRIELPVTLYEAVLGAKVRVPTLTGAVDLAIPAGSSSGRTFRLKGKGLKAKTAQGDLYATLRIVLPEGNDPELEELMRRWQAQKPYNPRSDLP